MEWSHQPYLMINLHVHTSIILGTHEGHYQLHVQYISYLVAIPQSHPLIIIAMSYREMMVSSYKYTTIHQWITLSDSSFQGISLNSHDNQWVLLQKLILK